MTWPRRFLSWARAGLPGIVLLIFAATAWLFNQPAAPQSPPEAGAAPPRPWRWSPAAAPADQPPPDLSAVRGSFLTRTVNGVPLLAMEPDPMIEGSLEIPKLLRREGTVRVLFSGERTRRASPRFAISLRFPDPLDLRWREIDGWAELADAQGQRARVDFQVPTENEPVWLELLVAPTGSTAVVEGRLWPASSPRPAQPQLTHPLPAAPGLLTAAITPAPFALKPVFIHEILVFSQRP